MKCIGCSVDIRNNIRDASLSGESVDETLNRLLDSVGTINKDYDFTNERTNINVSDETYDRLTNYKLHDKENLTRTIKRLLLTYEELGVMYMKVNGSVMSLDMFKEDVLDRMNVVFSEDYSQGVICTPAGMAVSELKFDFSSDDEKRLFVEFVNSLDY